MYVEITLGVITEHQGARRAWEDHVRALRDAGRWLGGVAGMTEEGRFVAAVVRASAKPTVTAAEALAPNLAPHLDVLDTLQGSERGRVDRTSEPDQRAAQRPFLQPLDILDGHQHPLADDAHPVRNLLHLGDHMRREEDRPTRAHGLAHQPAPSTARPAPPGQAHA